MVSTAGLGGTASGVTPAHALMSSLRSFSGVERRVRSRGAAGFFIAIAVMNASNYVFHVVVSRGLGPGEYGGLSSLLAVLLVLSVPLNALQTTVAKRTAQLRVDGRGRELPSLSSATVRLLCPFAFVACLGFALAAPAVGAFLRVGIMSVALLGAYVLGSSLLAVPLGVMQGLERFRAMASVMLAGVFVRLVMGVVLVDGGWGIEGALLATVLGPAVSLVLAQRLLWRRRGDRDATSRPWSVTLLRGEFRPTLLGLGAFWVLAGVDVVLARHYLGPEQAGFYSSAAILARALLFVPGAVSTVAFPWFVRVARGTHDAARWLVVTTVTVAGLVLLASPPLILFRREAVTFAFGQGFAPAAGLLPVLALSMGVLAVANLLVYFCIAQGVRSHVIVLGGVAVEGILISIFHEDPTQVVACMGVVAGLVTAALWIAAWAVARPGGGASSIEDGLPVTEVTAIADRPRDVSPRLSLVLPCYNGADTLADVLDELTRELADLTTYEVILVSDGSVDGTVATAARFADRGVRVLAYERNVGKGYALRVGLAAARGRYVAYMDADGDIDPEGLGSFLTLVDLYDPDIVVASKRHPMSQIDYPLVRRALSWTYHRLTRAMFRLNLRDTQTGFKLLRSDVLAAVLPRVRQRGYAFDLELLVVAARLGYTRVFEAPVRIGFRSASKMRMRTALRMGVDAGLLFGRRYVLDGFGDPKSYGRSPREPRAEGATDHPDTTAERRTTIPVPPIRSDEITGRPPRRGDDEVVDAGCLRILVLNWRDIANPDAGGAEVFTHEVARRWVSWGHDVTLLTSRFPGGRPNETIDGVRIRRVGVLRHGSFHLHVQRELRALQGYDVLIDEINSIPFLTPVWSDRLPPVVALIHQLAEDVWDSEVPSPLAAIGRRAEPRMLRMYHDVPTVTVSTSTKADLERLGFRDVRLVLQGRDEPPSIDVLREPRPTVLFVGRLAANKRPDHAVAAYRALRERLPGARLWIVGSGVMEDDLRREAGDGVELLGRVDRRELYERMARAHCLLVPSVREGWGLVITEANAVGTPAVGYDVPGIRDAIRDGRTGLLAPPGDAVTLGRLAAELLSDPDRYRRTQIEAQRWGCCFSWDTTAELMLAVLAEQARVAGTAGREVGGAALAPAG
jgi:glycosyltransferase involved in cell wall biosynthesis/O-antigen/teichoic acid export membrane protein